MGHSVSGAGVAAPSGQGVSLSAGGNVLIARGSWGRRVGECGVGGGGGGECGTGQGLRSQQTSGAEQEQSHLDWEYLLEMWATFWPVERCIGG